MFVIENKCDWSPCPCRNCWAKQGISAPLIPQWFPRFVAKSIKQNKLFFQTFYLLSHQNQSLGMRSELGFVFHSHPGLVGETHSHSQCKSLHSTVTDYGGSAGHIQHLAHCSIWKRLAVLVWSWEFKTLKIVNTKCEIWPPGHPQCNVGVLWKEFLSSWSTFGPNILILIKCFVEELAGWPGQ